MLHTPTPRAAAAIIQQIERKGDDTGFFCADVDGQEHEFEARFDTDWRNLGGHYFNRDVVADCALIGAWAYDPNGDVLFAGNKAEMCALVGERAVSRWEASMSERVTEAGE